MELEANVTFRFRAESVAAAGGELRRLKEAAAEVGFDLRRGKVEPAKPEPSTREGTSYVPLDPAAGKPKG
jgi:hypothetical protein